ncbi:hypothetical protein [Polluticoccus soli]|uniref:hypothetical protein n=1 Tax=Polluticoccus soli TaxID=3034150 RepID=UPI0023E24355|nr:hypothetical protein [Flavipsychrobacter sp. JY13-12]
MNLRLKYIHRYAGYVLIIVALLASYSIGTWDTDLGDYAKQINQLSNTGSLISAGQLNNRYPPITSLIYFTAFKLLGFAGKGAAILLLHTLLTLLIQRGFELLLKHFEYNASTILKKLATTIVIFNPYILSFIVRGVNSELIFICCSLYAVWFALKKGNSNTNLLITGLLAGLVILTRMQGLALAISLLILLTRRKLLPATVFALAVVLTITPWQYFNSKYGSGFIASGGLPSFRDGLSFNNKKYRQPIELPDNVKVLSDSFYYIYYTLKEGEHIAPARDEVSFVKHYLADEPKTAVELFWLKLRRSFYGTDSQNPKVEMLNKLLIGITLLFFLISSGSLVRQNNQRYNTLLLFIFTYSVLTVGMSVMVLSILRYQAPLLSFWLLVCFIAAQKLLERRHQRSILHKKHVPVPKALDHP